MARDYYYDYGFEFDEVDDAFEVAKGFHESLRNSLDYKEERVVLSFEGPRVSLSIYPDSKIDIRIEDDGNGPYISYR